MQQDKKQAGYLNFQKRVEEKKKDKQNYQRSEKGKHYQWISKKDA